MACSHGPRLGNIRHDAGMQSRPQQVDSVFPNDNIWLAHLPWLCLTPNSRHEGQEAGSLAADNPPRQSPKLDFSISSTM